MAWVHVSAAPSFIWHSGAVGWQGAFLAELWTAPAGLVEHVHEHYCLRRTLTDYARRMAGQVSWESVRAGAWTLWQPDTEQRSEWKGRGRRQFLFITTPRLEQLLERSVPAGAVDRSRRTELAPVVERLLDALGADLAAGSPAGPLVGDCLVTAMCAVLFEPSSRTPSVGGLARGARRRVLDRIEHDLQRRLTLDQLAAEAGLGTRHFSRAFRATFGQTPYQYVLDQRIARAQRLIADGWPLTEVARSCGFADQSQLARVFTRRVGISPSAYRRMRR